MSRAHIRHCRQTELFPLLKGTPAMNNTVTPFAFESHQLRVQMDEQGQPWFNAADVCAALEMGNPRQALESHVDAEDVQKLDTLTAGGQQSVNHINESGLYALIMGSRKESAKRFKRWVTADVLPTLRKTGSYAMPQAAPQPSVAAREFRALFGIARLIGCDRNAAAISANQAVAKLTGFDMLQTLGHTHLEAPRQDTLWFTPSELGQRLNLSGRHVNRLLARAGLQARQGQRWQPLDAARGLYRLLDTGKRHHSGAYVTQIKWSDDVLSRLQGQQP